MNTTAVEQSVASPPTQPRARFGRAFWILNSIEMWERLAFFNLRVMAPIYIMQADDPGGLHLTAADKGTIYAWWAAFQSLLPIATGGYADRFGYKRTLSFALSLMMVGYLMIAFLRDVGWISNYRGFFAGILVLATGTAFFKPSIQGSLAHQMTKENSSVGWGLFYWVVNVGAFIGHYLPSILLSLSVMLPGVLRATEHSAAAWRNLFLASAVFTGFNLLTLFVVKDVPSGASKTETVLQVLWRTLRDVCEPRLIAWLAIMSCFWLMMYQIWDLQPNFIADWVNSGGMADASRWLPNWAYHVLVEQTPRGPMIPQQVLLSANSMFIILGVVGVAWLTRRMRTLTAMLFGMLCATVGVLVAGWTTNAWILVLGILFFSLGEMATGPKKIEYLSLIAPPGKKGLYLGYVNIPVGVGVYAGSMIAGYFYGHFGEKAVLAQRYLATHPPLAQGASWTPAWGADLWHHVCHALYLHKLGLSADSVCSVERLGDLLGVKRTEAMVKLQEVTGLDPVAAARLLWDTYHPHLVWVPFAAIGVVAAAALWLFGQRAKKWSDMNA